MPMKLQAPKAGKTLLQAKDSNILVQKQSQTVFMSLRADMPDTLISGTWKLHRSFTPLQERKQLFSDRVHRGIQNKQK